MEPKTGSIPVKGVLAGILAIWAGFGACGFFLFQDWPNRGLFGDMFGAVNALFSGLAFAGVVLTIWLQRQELALQREELKLTREELKRSAEAQERSEEALRKQAASLKATAKLNAINALLAHYASEIENLRDKPMMEGTYQQIHLRNALEQRGFLLSKLKDIYDDKE